MRVGDIIKGLSDIEVGSCEGLYCSHILEHLSLGDMRKALANSHFILKDSGIFRPIVPDLEYYIDQYQPHKHEGAANTFMESTMLGVKERKRGLKGVMEYIFGNTNHLWMWDYTSLKRELENVGFKDIRRCEYGDCEDEMFLKVEDPARFRNAQAIECRKGK